MEKNTNAGQNLHPDYENLNWEKTIPKMLKAADYSRHLELNVSVNI